MGNQNDKPAAVEAQDAPPSFETSAERLGAIVQQLESGELSLEKSLELFEEGVRVARLAQARLDEAEKRVDELLGVDDEGRPRTRPLPE
jgi:exodeoxyribonuclease VII small subunit